jgi:hypothetical protein
MKIIVKEFENEEELDHTVFKAPIPQFLGPARAGG